MSEDNFVIFPEAVIFEKDKNRKVIVFIKNLSEKSVKVIVDKNSKVFREPIIHPGGISSFYFENLSYQQESDPNVEVSIIYQEDVIFRKKIPIEYVEKWTPSQKMDKLSEKMDIFKCPICRKSYSESVEEQIPRVLNGCGHSICSECLSLLQRERISLCPFDSVEIGSVKQFEKQLSSQKETNVFPENLSILSMMRKEQLDKEQLRLEELKYAEPSAQPCAEYPGHTATVFCDSCSADFCEDCFTRIHTLKVFSNHKQVPISDKPIKLPKCSKHPYNTAEFICKETTCKIDWKDMCHTCLLVEHKGHQYEILIRKWTENDKKLREKLEELKLREADMEDKLEKKGEILKSFKDTSQQFRQKKQAISDYFEKKKSAANEKLSDYAKKNLEELAKEKEELKNGLMRTVNVRKIIERLVNSKKDLHSVRDITLEAEKVCKEPIVQETHVPLDQLSTSWKNGTELLL